MFNHQCSNLRGDEAARALTWNAAFYGTLTLLLTLAYLPRPKSLTVRKQGLFYLIDSPLFFLRSVAFNQAALRYAQGCRRACTRPPLNQ